MGRFGLILLVILVGIFVYQTQDAGFEYDKASVSQQNAYLVRAGRRLSHSPGFAASMFSKLQTVKPMPSRRYVQIITQQPKGFRLTVQKRGQEMGRKCLVYLKSSLMRNRIQARIRYTSETGRSLGQVTLSPNVCQRYAHPRQIAQR